MVWSRYINLKTPQSLIWSYNHSILINQRHPWEKKILYPILTIDRPISLWLFGYLNCCNVSMGTAPTARHESCQGLAYKGKNINMISLNTEIAFEPFEDSSYWNHKHAYCHPRYVMNNLIVKQIFRNERFYRWWLTLLLTLFLVDVTHTWNAETGARKCYHLKLILLFCFVS